MSELAPVLGILSIILTFVASYRLSSIFYGQSPVLSILISSGAAITFMILFEIVTLLVGLGVVLLPVIGLIYWWDGTAGPSISTKSLRDRVDSIIGNRSTMGSGNQSNSGSGNSGSGNQSNVNSGDNPSACANCGTSNPESKSYCRNCGSRL
jgi:hypothetical protein